MAKRKISQFGLEGKNSIHPLHYLGGANEGINPKLNFKIAVEDLFPSITSLGGGVSLYKGVQNRNEFSLKSLVSTDGSIVITDLDDTVSLEVNPSLLTVVTPHSQGGLNNAIAPEDSGLYYWDNVEGETTILNLTENFTIVDGELIPIPYTAGNGISITNRVVEVNFGNTVNTSVRGNTELEIIAGDYLTGGGTVVLGDGGTLTIHGEDQSQNVFTEVITDSGTLLADALETDLPIKGDGVYIETSVVGGEVLISFLADFGDVTGQNVGSGSGLSFKQKSGNFLQFRSFRSSDGSVSIFTDSDTVDFRLNVPTTYSALGGVNINSVSRQVSLKNYLNFTNQYLLQWNAGNQQLENSIITSGGGLASILGSGYVQTNLSIGNQLRLNSASTYYSGFRAPTLMNSNVMLDLPDEYPNDAGQVPTWDPNGAFSGWEDIGGGGADGYIQQVQIIGSDIIFTGVGSAYTGTLGLPTAQGTQGIQGNSGIQGAQGLIGIQGYSGVIGLTGTQGIQGTRGLQGIQGLIGLQGIQGTQGTKGDTGDTGIQGIEGAQGTEGLQGIQGLAIQGAIGDTGIQGLQGLQGIQGLLGIGEQGIQGIQGAVGETGETGGAGAQGTQGIQGLYGLQGLQGAVGAGETGSQGIQGLLGIQGVQGIQGLHGEYAAQGIQGNTGIQGSAGYIGADGIQGFVGIQGIQGLHGLFAGQGVQGIQGFIGETGGEGIQGAQGTIGIQGSFGETGATGSQGTQGIQGTKGDIGTTGIQGIQGIAIQGTVGAQGIQGSRGLQGIQGSRGLQGIQGIQGNGIQGLIGQAGAQGIQGLRGPDGIIGLTGAQGTQGIQGIAAYPAEVQFLEWENDNISQTFVSGVDPSTIYWYNQLNGFDTPVGNVVLTLDPDVANTLLPNGQRSWRIVFQNNGRVYLNRSWKVRQAGTGITTKELIDYRTGSVTPHMLEFFWDEAISQYRVTKIELETLTNDLYLDTGDSFGLSFRSKLKIAAGAWDGTQTLSAESSTTIPAGSIIFIKDAFVLCQAALAGSSTTISFGLSNISSENNGVGVASLTTGDESGVAVNLSDFGVVSNDNNEIIRQSQPLSFYSLNGPVFGVDNDIHYVRNSVPVSISIKLNGGGLSAGFIGVYVPYMTQNTENATYGALVSTAYNLWVTGGNAGAQGIQGVQGPTGAQGIQGLSIQGIQGLSGAGNDGSNTLRYGYNNGVSATSETFGVNTGGSIAFSAVTYFDVSGTAANSVNASAWHSAIKSRLDLEAGIITLKVTEVGNNQNFGLYTISGYTPTNKYIVSAVLASSGNLDSTKTYSVSWMSNGIQGVQGIQGIQGLNGSYAAQGIQGPMGIQGVVGQGVDQAVAVVMNSATLFEPTVDSLYVGKDNIGWNGDTWDQDEDSLSWRHVNCFVPIKSATLDSNYKVHVCLNAHVSWVSTPGNLLFSLYAIDCRDFESAETFRGDLVQEVIEGGASSATGANDLLCFEFDQTWNLASGGLCDYHLAFAIGVSAAADRVNFSYSITIDAL